MCRPYLKTKARITMSDSMTELLNIMKALRHPETGCPWDIEQDFESIAPFTIEEAYEVADAIERRDYQNLQEELGDLLLQVVFHSQMASEENVFSFNDVVDAITTKLIHRHPHVFGDQKSASAEDVEKIWNAQKEKEKKENALKQNAHIMDEVPRHFPALLRAQKIQKKAITQGFNWPHIDGVFAKLHEEIDELKEAIESQDQKHIEEELGDLLFVCGILGRWLNVDAEHALQQSNNKFIRRFNKMEDALKAEGLSLSDADLRQMDEQWDRIKMAEKQENAA